jgi:CysZ protein
MIAAFQKAVSQLSDPALRRVIWRTLLLAVVAYVLVWGLSWFAISSFKYFDIPWLNDIITYLGIFAVTILSLLLFPATFGMILSVFLEEIADIVEHRDYPALGPAAGIPIWVGLLSGLKFFLLLVAINIVLLPIYLVAMFFAGAGLVLAWVVNGWLIGNEYYEQVALRRRPPGEVKAWRKSNAGKLWLTGIAVAIMATVPFLNLLAPVLGCAMMVHVAQTLRPPPLPAPTQPFGSR